VAVPRSAVPFTLKAAEFSVFALQHSSIAIRLGQHIYYISVLHSGIFFFRKHLEVLVRLFHVASTSQWDGKELVSLGSNSAFKQTLDESMESLHGPEERSVCNSSINS